MKYAFLFRENLSDVEVPDFVKLMESRGEKVTEISRGHVKRFQIDDGIPHVHQILVELPKPPETVVSIPPLNLYFESLTLWVNGGRINPAGFSLDTHDQLKLVRWCGIVTELLDMASNHIQESRTVFVRVMEERGCIFTISSENN